MSSSLVTYDRCKDRKGAHKMVRGSYGYNWLCKSCKYQLQHPK